MTDLFKAQPLEDPHINNIQLDENVVAGKVSCLPSFWGNPESVVKIIERQQTVEDKKLIILSDS